jgi:hypothetical protein
MSRSLRRGLAGLAGLCLAIQLGCGTLLYPERHGSRGGRVDPGVIVMDGVLLIFFVVPGLVAYAIDFYTGSVYVSGSKSAGVYRVNPATLRPEQIDEMVRAHSDAALPLDRDRLVQFELPRDESPQVTLSLLRQAATDPDWQPPAG